MRQHDESQDILLSSGLCSSPCPFRLVHSLCFYVDRFVCTIVVLAAVEQTSIKTLRSNEHVQILLKCRKIKYKCIRVK